MQLTENIRQFIPNFKKMDSITFILYWSTLLIFFLKIIPLFIFPIPTYLHAADTVFHYKRIELIKQNLAYIGYEPYYPKGFHIPAALLSFLIPTGTAIAIVTLIYSALFILYAYKLGFHFSNNRQMSLLTAFFSIAITIAAEVGGVPTPVPQTAGLALMLMSLYYFIKNKYFISGALLGLHAITHFSWPITIFLIGIYFLLNEKIAFKSIKEKIVTVAVPFLILVLSYNAMIALTEPLVETPFEQQLNFIRIITNYLGPDFTDLNISPFSMHLVTEPPFVLVLAFLGAWLIRKNFDKNKKFLLSWLLIMLILSQSYWLIERVISFGLSSFLTVFIGSRFLIYLIFPLAFFSAAALSEIINRGNIFKTAGILAVLAVLLISIPDFGIKPNLNENDLKAIEELKKLPVDAVVLTDYNGISSTIVILGLKVQPYQRDAYLMMSGFDTIDSNHLDYVLGKLPDGSYKIYDLRMEKAFFEPKIVGQTIKRVEIKMDYNKSTNLQNYVAPFLLTTKDSIGQAIATNLIVYATDTQEKLCLKDGPFAGNSCQGINENQFITIKGKKQDLIALFDSFDNGILRNRLVYLYRTNKISFEPELALEYRGATHSLRDFSNIYRWVHFQSELSQPNSIVGEFFYRLFGPI